jgi:ribose transport system substrate-binding protein
MAACGGGSSAGRTTSGGTAGGGSGKKITLMVGVKGDPFYVSMQCGAQAAADAAGAKLTVQGPDKFDRHAAEPAAGRGAATKPDALLVRPKRRQGLHPAAEADPGAGTKVVPGRHHVDDTSIGVLADRHRQRAGRREGRGGAPAARGKGKVLVISTDPGVSTWTRASTVQEEGRELGMTLAQDTQYSHNQPATAAQIISPPCNGARTWPASSPPTCFSAQGTATGEDGREVRSGEDGRFRRGPGQIKQLEAGDCRRWSRRSLTHRQQGVEQAMNALGGKSAPPRVDTTR